MKQCAAVKRMKAACSALKPHKLSSELSNLEAEMDAIAKLLVKCCNDYILNEDADGLKYMSEIDAVKTYLPEPESYRNMIEKNRDGSFNDPANPEFYKFEIIKVVKGTVTFKSLFSLEAADESVEKFVVVQVGQRAALILVRLARIASLQSRFYTALACCRVGLILVRFLYNISSPGLWTSHKILAFLLAAEAVESCTFLVAFDHPFYCRCAEIMDKAVLAYRDFLNIFRSYGDGLTISEADLMLTNGESLAEVRTIVENLANQLVDWSAGNDLLFNLSMCYFHLACKDVAVLKSALLTTVPPQDENVESCVRGFLSHPDSYMMGAALFCRGCFHSASGHKGLNQERTTFLMAAESDFSSVLDVANTSQILVFSIPWLRLIEKASLANLLTRCRILVRCAATFDVHHLRNSLDHLYSLVRTPSSQRLEDRISSCQYVSAVASLAFVYITDHIPGVPDLFDSSEKASVSHRRAECEFLASQLLQDEATLSFCLKVFCDLTQELLGGEDISNGETQLCRCLLRLKLLSMPIFAAVTSTNGALPSNATSSAGSDNRVTSPFFHGKTDDENSAEFLCESDCRPSRSSESGDEASTSSGSAKSSINILLDQARTSRDEFVNLVESRRSGGILVKSRESHMNDSNLNTCSHFNCRIQSIGLTENNNIELPVANATTSEPYVILADIDTIHSNPKQEDESLKITLEAVADSNKGPSSVINTPKLSVQMESSNAVPPVVSRALEDFVEAMLDRGFDILNRRTVCHRKKIASQNSEPVVEISSPSNEEWVAVFPPNLALPVGAGQTNLKSKAVTSQKIEHSLCVTQLSRVIEEAAVVLERNIKAKTYDNLFPILKEHPASQKAIQCGQNKGVKSKSGSLPCKLSDDSESWLAYLQRSSLLTTVEDSLDDLFVLDGTDDLFTLKNTIAKDLQNLCRATIGKHGSQSNENPAYLSVFAHSAYTTALQHLQRSSTTADFHFLLTTLCDALDENPYGSAARWT